MRSIGKVKIKKLKKVVHEMYEKNHDVTDDQVIAALPNEWFDTWEMAWQEIHMLVHDELNNIIIPR